MSGALALAVIDSGFRAAAIPSSVSGPFGEAGPSSVSAANGVLPLTYSWENRGGDPAIYAADATQQSTVFVTGGSVPSSATFVCVVTDATTRQVETNAVSVTLT